MFKKIDIAKTYNLQRGKICKECVVSNQRPRITFDKMVYATHVPMQKIKVL